MTYSVYFVEDEDQCIYGSCLPNKEAALKAVRSYMVQDLALIVGTYDLPKEVRRDAEDRMKESASWELEVDDEGNVVVDGTLNTRAHYHIVETE